VGSCPASDVEPTSVPIIESEAVMEDVLRPLEQALEDCRGHTRVSDGTPCGWRGLLSTAKCRYGSQRQTLTLWAMVLNPFRAMVLTP
jgi:hypothetical protein